MSMKMVQARAYINHKKILAMFEVSLLVPVYGVEKYIEKCARSLFEQTYKKIEYIFVDDCTPDDSIAVLQRVIEMYPNRKSQVKIVHHQKNRGLSAARNTAIRQASGDYIMHVDSDDYLELDAVEKAINKAVSDNADMVIFDMNHVYNDAIIRGYAGVPDDRLEYLHKIIRRDSTVCLCGGLYRRSLYVDNNVWAIEGLNYGEDYVTKPRLVYYAHKITYLPQPLYNYVQYNMSSYTQNITSKSIDDILKACEVLAGFFIKLQDDTVEYDTIEAELKIRNKVFLLEYCNNCDRRYVNRLFPEMKNKKVSMALKHKVVWWLSRYNMLRMMDVYVFISQLVKKSFHI